MPKSPQYLEKHYTEEQAFKNHGPLGDTQPNHRNLQMCISQIYHFSSFSWITFDIEATWFLLDTIFNSEYFSFVSIPLHGLL
jgi:hypothetical protein